MLQEHRLITGLTLGMEACSIYLISRNNNSLLKVYTHTHIMKNSNTTPTLFAGHARTEVSLDRRERLLAARGEAKGGNTESTYDYHNDPLYVSLMASVNEWGK